MRGKVFQKIPLYNYDGITPAYAGKSPTCDFCGRGTWDHPRLCGEKFVRVALLARIVGSPPPMRGKVFLSTSRAFCNRITPAYAGKSLFL